MDPTMNMHDAVAVIRAADPAIEVARLSDTSLEIIESHMVGAQKRGYFYLMRREPGKRKATRSHISMQVVGNVLAAIRNEQMRRCRID